MKAVSARIRPHVIDFITARGIISPVADGRLKTAE